MGSPAAMRHLFIGTYTSEGSEGICSTDLDLGSGELSPPVLAARTPDPSYLALHPRLPLLFAVGEGSDPGSGSGSIRAFRVDQGHKGGTGGLTFINSQPSGGK